MAEANIILRMLLRLFEHCYILAWSDSLPGVVLLDHLHPLPILAGVLRRDAQYAPSVPLPPYLLHSPHLHFLQVEYPVLASGKRLLPSLALDCGKTDCHEFAQTANLDAPKWPVVPCLLRVS